MCLAASGFTYLFAPHYHPATRAISPIRSALGVRTVFNVLGPLVNPAQPPLHLVGAFSLEVARLMADAFKALLHRPPRDCGFETGLWTLSLVAKAGVKQGWTVSQVSDETIRQTLKNLGINWKRAKHWMTSPDPLYFKKKRRAIV